jgi:DNA segregation ATPase FtsK/SpoIIIE, S-DNA-T family
MWLLGRVPVRRKVQILGLCLLSVAVFLALALATRDGRDTTTDLLSTGAVRNQGGVIGAISAAALCTALGTLGAWLIPLALAAWGWNRIRLRPAGELWLRTAVFACGTAAALGLLFLLTGGNRVLVGSSGEWIGAAASRLLGRVGSELVLGTALVVIAVVAFELNASSPLRKAAAALFARLLPAPSPKRRAAEASEPTISVEPVRRGRKAPIDEEEEALAFSATEEPRRESKPRIVARREAERAEAMTIPFPPPAPVSAPKEEKRRPGAGGLPAFAAGAVAAGAAADAALGIGPAVAADVALPSIDLLDRHESKHAAVEESELFELSRVLERTLADFDVAGKVSEVHPGPVITLFEYEPAPGVKVNQIMNRQDDLALSLKAQRIRIVAPIPGKAAVGIEIPNRRKSLVSFREIVVSKQFKETSDALPFALGKDVAGEPFTASLEKMPHLLIAGATGSGKSVCINTLIMSLLMKRKPAELQFIMIDPKMLELTPYNGIPHLRMPVVTDPKKAAQSLRFCVKQMEERYQLLAKHGARNIEAYNRLELEPAQHGATARLPYLVVVVDELADLMALLPTEIEEPIGRLAQMARAVGIHLILATQRPSVDVITGMIKANFPSRIAFQVASRVDSRVILDMNGAESLLGHGDSLFLPAGKPEPYRIHGSYVSADEIERVVSFLKSQGAPVAADDSALEQVRALEETESDDALFDEAMRLVVLHQQASTSMLQRRLKVGYSRAARLLDLLEERGVVGPSEGAKGREVLVTEHELAERRSASANGAPEDES